MENVRIQNSFHPLDFAGIIFLIIGTVFTSLGIVFSVLMRKGLMPGKGMLLLPVLFLGLGIFILVLGILFLTVGVKRRARIKKLVRDGYYIVAKIRDVYPDEHVLINGRSPFVVECSYHDDASGKTHIFKSEHIMFYPIDAQDTNIRVFVDPSDMDHYYVDISVLTDSVVIH